MESQLSGLPQYILDKASSGEYDGYAFIDKGGGKTGIGFWKTASLGKILQLDHYPGVFFEQVFNGGQIQIFWEKTSRGLEIWPDGTYIIRNFPLDYDVEGNIQTNRFVVQFRPTDSSVVLEKH